MPASRLVASVALMSLAVGVTPALAETTKCTSIAAVPAVITVPGIYCFTKALVTSVASGAAITIQAHNVVLDMNGFRLGGLGAGLSTTTIGIHAIDRQNITIRNGTVRGFHVGILLEDNASGSLGHLVEDVRADQNTWIGIAVMGVGSIVRNNQVVATGGTTVTLEDPHIPGIVVFGDGHRVINNDVISVATTQGAPSVGIGIVGGSANVVLNNRITNADMGVLFDGATGKYRDTLTSAVTTPYTGGTDAGNNN